MKPRELTSQQAQILRLTLTPAGMSRTSLFDDDAVILDQLKMIGLCGSGENAEGETRYSATELGRVSLRAWDRSNSR
ncbi:hypothetical protein [Oricola sp.]|uniref:hypothetical protein n=1 Tax=Oricola sp. TaxID=1979950 RepID=UPI003BA8D27F